MPFFAPWMLLGLIAAAAPIILHLFRKRTARRIIWGAWQFLVESMRRRHRRILIEEILLLIIRTAILALAAIAFARPFLPEMGFFGGGEKDVVIVLDRSGSMNLKRKDGTTAFDAAVKEARELIDRSPRGVSFGLVLGGREAEILTPTPFSSKREVLKLLDEVKVGEETMDVPRALEAASGVLSGGNHLSKEIVIFGDGQSYGWCVDDVNAWRRVNKTFENFHHRPPVVWRTLERPESVKNAAISSVVPSRQIFGTDRELGFKVTVVNSGSVAFAPGELAFSVDGKRCASQPVGQILPGLSRTIPFSHKFDKTGSHTVVTSLSEGDDIVTDNVVTNPVNVIDELKVLLVNGQPGAMGFERPTAYVEAALRPERKDDKLPFLVRPMNVRPAELESTNIFGNVAVTILCDVPFLSDKAAQNLAKWTAQGGGLLAVPGSRVDMGFYSNWTYRAKHVMPAAWTNFYRSVSSEKPLIFEGAPIAGHMLFDEATIQTNEVSVGARLNDGAIASVFKAFFNGRVGMLAMPLDLKWTGLPARPKFVPFVHELVYSLSSIKSITETRDVNWSAREGDIATFTSDEIDTLSAQIDLSFARSQEDALAAVVGRGFGVEVWRPIGIIVLILMLVEILMCRMIDRTRAGEGVQLTVSRLRIVLRTIAILSVCWMLAHLVWVTDRTRKISRKVAILTDSSLSMNRRDTRIDGATNDCTRLDFATNLTAQLEARLGKKYDLDSVSFGGDTTDFAAALENVRSRVPSEELAGVVLVTDGRSTAGADVESVVRVLARQGVKVSSVVVGNVTNRSDVAIEDVYAPEGIFLGDVIHAQVVLRADLMKGEKVTVRFWCGEKELEKEEFTIDSDDWTKELRFTDEPKEKGIWRYRITLETSKKDAESANNVWPFDVSVSDDRTNVLIADRRPRWEFRYLRNLFYGRDKSVHLQYLLCEPDRLDGETRLQLAAADATRQFGDAESGCLPSGRDAWRKFDVIILGDLDPDSLLDEEVADIRACVEERGALLVFIAGEKFMPLAYAKSQLAELLPVTLTNGEGRLVAEWKQGSFGFTVTGAGYAHEMMCLSDSNAENIRIWETGCEWQRRLDKLIVKPGAETLAFAGDSTALEGPLLVVQHRGRGRVVFLSSDETWRFRYRIGDTYHHRFWGNMLKWGAGIKLRDGNAYVRIGTDRIHYSPGSPVKIRARLMSAESLPLDGLKVDCTVVRPDGARRTFPLPSRTTTNGTYEGEFNETWTNGEYRVEISCAAARKQLGDKWPDKPETSFMVKNSFAPVEFAALSSDRELAEAMAKATGGMVLPNLATNLTLTAQLSMLDDSFGTGRTEAVEHIENHIWDHPSVFILLAVALIIVWILRKRRGLA